MQQSEWKGVDRRDIVSDYMGLASRDRVIQELAVYSEQEGTHWNISVG